MIINYCFSIEAKLESVFSNNTGLSFSICSSQIIQVFMTCSHQECFYFHFMYFGFRNVKRKISYNVQWIIIKFVGNRKFKDKIIIKVWIISAIYRKIITKYFHVLKISLKFEIIIWKSIFLSILVIKFHWINSIQSSVVFERLHSTSQIRNSHQFYSEYHIEKIFKRIMAKTPRGSRENTTSYHLNFKNYQPVCMYFYF